MDLSSISKAVAGGLTGALVAVLAHFGFQAHAETITALSVVITAVVGYLIGHIVVYFAPANKLKI